MGEFIYGFHAITAMVRKSPECVATVYLDENKKDRRTAELIRLLNSRAVSHRLISRSELQNSVGDVVHQGVVARIDNRANREKAELPGLLSNMGANETLLLLDGVVDPANLGACLRVADAAGVDSVILTKDRSVPVTPVVRKVAAGAADSVNILTVTNLVRTIGLLKDHGFWIFGLADEMNESLYDQQFDGRVAVIVGNEGRGLRQLTRKSCDHLLAIPMLGQVESLNVAVAAGITLYEIHRQRIAQS